MIALLLISAIRPGTRFSKLGVVYTFTRVLYGHAIIKPAKGPFERAVDAETFLSEYEVSEPAKQIKIHDQATLHRIAMAVSERVMGTVPVGLETSAWH